MLFKPYIQKALQEIGFIKLTEIQKEIIPQALEGKSVIGKSLTGTGKTHAFLLPILQNLEEDKRFCQSIFLSPTRELAFQLYEETLKITKHSDIHIDVRLYTGGTDREDDIKTSFIISATNSNWNTWTYKRFMCRRKCFKVTYCKRQLLLMKLICFCGK